MTNIVVYDAKPFAPLIPFPPPTTPGGLLQSELPAWARNPATFEDLIGESISLWYSEDHYVSTQFELSDVIKLSQRSRVLTDEWLGTSLPQQLVWRIESPTTPVQNCAGPVTGSTTGPSLISAIQDLSGLTLEEVAPLLGVSRRSLQHWKARRNISARKEKRLRDLADFLGALPIKRPSELRQVLLSRVPGNLRPYDLLADGQYGAAYEMITRSPAPPELGAQAQARAIPAGPPVMARLSIRNESPSSHVGRVDLRRSRRIRR